MKHLLLLLLFVFSFSIAISQSTNYKEIELTSSSIELSDRTFYIQTVLDKRIDKSSIGFILDENNDKIPLKFKTKMSYAIYNYYKNALPKNPNQKPIIIFIKEVLIKEQLTENGPAHSIAISIDFYHKKNLIYKNTVIKNYKKNEISTVLNQNFTSVFKNILEQFHKSDWKQNLKNQIELKTKHKIALDSIKPFKTTNVFAIGYQIGGYSLIGMNYEIMLSDKVGFHFGVGFKGYTFGLKFRPNPSLQNFLNLSFKDGGFGLIRALGLEYGGRLGPKRKGSSGFHFQIGLARILTINPYLDHFLFGKKDTDWFLSLGVGINFIN